MHSTATLTGRRVQLYALFKQGTQDPPIEQSPVPTGFDLKVSLLNVDSHLRFIMTRTFDGIAMGPDLLLTLGASRRAKPKERRGRRSWMTALHRTRPRNAM